MAHESASEVNVLLEKCLPLSALELLGEEPPQELMIYKVQALLYLDRPTEAERCLEPLLGQLAGDDLARCKRLWAQLQLRKHQIDEAIFCAQESIQAAASLEVRVRSMTLLASAYSEKACFQLAESALRDAKVLVGPRHAMVLLTEAEIKLEMDERLAARELYKQVASCDEPWAQYYSDLGCSTVALLLGDFEEARSLAESCLAISDQMVPPYYVLAHLAQIEEDAASLERVIGALAQRIPDAETLPKLQTELDRLKKQQCTPAESRHRLKEFPTTVQKRNYCGPSTMDLILRFWKSSDEFTDEQIAAYVKLPHSGTPIYRMREFFNLVGFDTIRCLAPVENLRSLISAGFPVIVTEAFSETSHVSVVIGYDESTKTIEFQDPMTHNVLAIPEDAVSQVRRPYLNSAILAFPHGKGHEKTLSQLGFFDEPSVVWSDHAELDLEQGRFADAAVLMERAVKRLPAHELSWILLLSAALEEWRKSHLPDKVPGLVLPLARLRARSKERAERKRFYAFLKQAQSLFPDSRMVYWLAGQAALVDHRLTDALAAFQRATEIDGGDSRNFSSLAETYFMLRQPEAATKAAREALKRFPMSAPPNVWMARCLAAAGDNQAEHYARCALELAPNWWMAHLAMAEASLQKKDPLAARRELDIAIGLQPDEPELLVLRGLLAAEGGASNVADVSFRDALRSERLIGPRAEYAARQALCRFDFGARKFERAKKQAQKLLRIAPEDVWVQQFLAAATAESVLARGRKDPQASRETRRLYARAISTSRAAAWVVADFLNYLDRLEGPAPAWQEIEKLRKEYPENAALITLHARALTRLGRKKEAGELMLDAIGREGAIQDGDVLMEAVQTAVDGLGAEEATQAILGIPEGEKIRPLQDRRRALGLVFAKDAEKTGDRAKEFLEDVINKNPEDVMVSIRLGAVVADEARREEFYHRAVRLAPAWSFARMNLAHYLLDRDRAAEALEYTYGHQHESVELMVTYGRALFSLGRFDEASGALRAALTQLWQPPSWLYHNQWLAESRSGDHKAALATARRALSKYPQEKWWYLPIADSLRSLGRFPAAAREIERARFDGLSWDGVLQARFEHAWDQGRFKEALDIVNLQLKREPKKTGKYLNDSERRKLRLLLELGHQEEAGTLVDIQKLDTTAAWLNVIWICMEAQAWDQVAAYSQCALEIDPQDFGGMFGRAEALAESGHRDEGLEAYKALRSAHPYQHNAHEKLALHAALDGRLDEALVLAERGVLLGEFCAFAWATRGYVYFLQGQWDLARSDLEIAWKHATIDDRRHEAWAWWVLACLQTRPLVAWRRRLSAQRQAKTDWHRVRIRQIREQLKRTEWQRARESMIFTRARELGKYVVGAFHKKQPAPS